MAHDRSADLRREVAWALRKIHDEASLPAMVILVSSGSDRDIQFELIKWGDESVPHIVNLIARSTDSDLAHAENTVGEGMIRGYLSHWPELDLPIDEHVVSAVRTALKNKDPDDGGIRIEYHKKFLNRIDEF